MWCDDDTSEPMLSVQLWIGTFTVELVNYHFGLYPAADTFRVWNGVQSFNVDLVNITGWSSVRVDLRTTWHCVRIRDGTGYMVCRNTAPTVQYSAMASDARVMVSRVRVRIRCSINIILPSTALHCTVGAAFIRAPLAWAWVTANRQEPMKMTMMLNVRKPKGRTFNTDIT